jgi:O-acetyl-ADP-ribose deacetylase (regulator of RNase III)
MQTYTFSVILGDQTEMTEDLTEALAAAGCDDGLAGSSGGVAAVIFDRAAESLEQAVRSAIADMQKAGCRAAWVRIEPQDLTAAAPASASMGPRNGGSAR